LNRPDAEEAQKSAENSEDNFLLSFSAWSASLRFNGFAGLWLPINLGIVQSQEGVSDEGDGRIPVQ
jgi:hypothetical protein